MEQTHTHIRASLSRRKPGELVFPREYRGHGTEAAIKKAMSRLVKEGKVRRLSHGIYYVPKVDPVFGEIRPNAEEVVKMIAKKDKVRIRPTGAYALHRLGLTTQVPTKLVYITDGTSKKFRIGKLPVMFKATSHRKLAMKGEISSLLIQAMEELGKNDINPSITQKISQLLDKENPKILKHDLSLAPAWINDFIVKLLRKGDKNDELVKPY